MSATPCVGWYAFAERSTQDGRFGTLEHRSKALSSYEFAKHTMISLAFRGHHLTARAASRVEVQKSGAHDVSFSAFAAACCAAALAAAALIRA